MAAHGAAAWPEGRRCRWKPEVGDDALVGHTGPKGRAERTGFGGSEGEMKMDRATKWAESQGGYIINSFFLFLNFKQDFRFKKQRFEILLN
jgi:hypothetical protein